MDKRHLGKHSDIYERIVPLSSPVLHENAVLPLKLRLGREDISAECNRSHARNAFYQGKPLQRLVQI